MQGVSIYRAASQEQPGVGSQRGKCETSPGSTNDREPTLFSFVCGPSSSPLAHPPYTDMAARWSASREYMASRPAKETVDVIVVGAGHNGLVAATVRLACQLLDRSEKLSFRPPRGF